MSINIVESIVTANKCYQVGAPLSPQGLMLHSIGVPQPNAAVMAQNYNQYRPNGQSVCVHAFVQRDGTVYQTLPWTVQAWHCGGSANSTHIGVEMTEPDCIRYTGGATFVCSDRARALAQVTGTYNTAVALFAWLCQRFGLDPNKDIISHAEASAMGIGTDHADPEHLWRQLGTGYTMDGFRRDVAEAMDENDNEEDEESVVRYNNLEEVPSWAQGTVRALVDAGALRGDEHGNLDLSMDMIRGLMIGAKYAEACNPRYNSINDVPSWARPGVQRLVDRGALAGTGGGKLDLSLDMLRTLVVCQRMMEDAAR